MENNNRILNEIIEWNDNVKNLQGVFGKQVADYRYLVRAKLEHFRQIKAKYKMLANQDEKIASKILQAEIQRLWKIAFPNRIERLVRNTIETAGAIFKKVLRNGRSEQQIEMKKEIIRVQKPMETGNYEKHLNKSAIQYDRKLKAIKGDTLLPKLRNSNGKGLKM